MRRSPRSLGAARTGVAIWIRASAEIAAAMALVVMLVPQGGMPQVAACRAVYGGRGRLTCRGLAGGVEISRILARASSGRDYSRTPAARSEARSRAICSLSMRNWVLSHDVAV